MANNIFEKMTEEERTLVWMYMIFNKDKIIEKTEQWTKEAEKAGMTLTEYLESINPLDTNKEELPKYEAKVVTRGNCMMCGKELTEGLFFCKECEEKGCSYKAESEE